MTNMLVENLAKFERRLVLRALTQASGNRAAAAKLLGIRRTTLIEKMKRLNLVVPSPLDNKNKTHCPRGHEYTKDNTYWVGPKKTFRRCSTCQKNSRKISLQQGPKGDCAKS